MLGQKFRNKVCTRQFDKYLEMLVEATPFDPNNCVSRRLKPTEAVCCAASTDDFRELPRKLGQHIS